MKYPQVINLLEDSVLIIPGISVIDDTTQIPMAPAITTMSVNFTPYNITTGAVITESVVTFSYVSAVDSWTLDVADIDTNLVDRNKYVARISPYMGTPNLRPFTLSEFAIDNESFEATWMRLPYQVEISGTDAHIRWYNSVSDFDAPPFTAPTLAVYEAAAYEGGSGVVFATDPGKVTHRGPIVTL